MDAEDNLSELNLTEEEMGRFAKAFKDEKFRKLLQDYAEEISNPDNKKKYEEEITILEQHRGNSVQFIHPTPFKCVKTSVNGKLKGYVNLCASDKIGKPSCKSGVSQDGKSGHHWSLPHSMHPERNELDPKGNKILIYDVVFHPDTLHMASTNERFMAIVTTAALDSIQEAFNVRLDKNIKNMRTKYKGSLQASVIRKPIPGFQPNNTSDEPDHLAFPYPDNKATISKKENPNKSPSNSENPQETQGPTKPLHTLKYRSFIDLQDFRCSRDSGRSPRPDEIVITIDLPLLKSVAATTLEVKEKSLLLESQDPAYKLELSFAYAVDEDRGAAKFNSQTRQLVVTLPVRPSEEGFKITSCPVEESTSEIQEEIAFGRENEGEWDGTDLTNEVKKDNSEECNAVEKIGEISEREEEAGATLEAREDDRDKSQHQEDIVQGQTQVEKDGNVTNYQIGQKGVETFLEAQIYEVKEEKEHEELVVTEDRVQTSELLIRERMSKDHLKSEENVEKATTSLVSVREVTKDGSQALISDDVTTAGLSFHNSLLYELD